jgi:transcriptional regulator with XRE-family HTH domain
MAYGHADKIARSAAREAPAAAETATPPIDPRLYDSPEVRRILAERDIGGLFRAVKATGISYRRIAALVGMSQSEVSEIISGRRVLAYDVLVRIAEGLGIPRELMGLSYDGGSRPHGDHDEHQTPAQEVDEAVQRRRFLNATIGIVVPAVFHHVVPRELLTPMDPLRPAVPTPLPSRLGMSDVDALRTLTERMRALARHYGGQAETISAIAHHSTRLMGVTGDKHVKADLGSALAELHTLAGWSAFDSGAKPDAIRGHFSCALDFAMEASDNYRASNALYHAAMTMQNDAPDKSLDLLQIAQYRLGQGVGSAHPRASVLGSWLHLDSAHALLMLGHKDAARSKLVRACEGWNPDDAFDAADFDHVTALAHRDLGMLDSAEALTVSSMRTWGREHRRDAAQASITLATIHVRAGEPDALRLANEAITGVAQLSSQRARDRLAPLAAALGSRPGSDYRELALMTRQVAATRA